MTTVFLVRHAEAEGNLYQRIHGQYDSLLTGNGYRQIEALEKRFEDIALDAIYSSDLFRARTTAKALCQQKGLPLIEREDLREMSLGDWEDKTWGEMFIEQKEQMVLFSKSHFDFNVTGGESFEALQNRITNAILDIAKKHTDESIAIVSHGMAIRMAWAHFSKAEDYNTLEHSDNTAVTKLEIVGDEVTVSFANDNSHLDESISTFAKQKWWKKHYKGYGTESLWYQPMDFSQVLYKGLYLACRQEAWVDLNRNMAEFHRQDYLERAQESYEKGSQYLLCTQKNNSIIGLLQMDPDLEKQHDAGYISFFYVLPEYRGEGYGVQMIGQAVSTYRPMGRKYLRLSCGEDNMRGKAFYERHGFYQIDERQSSYGRMNIMQKDIGLE